MASVGTRRAFVRYLGLCTAAMLSGCSSGGGRSTPVPAEATVTVRIRNRDAIRREYRVVVRQGDAVTNEFSGVLPADQQSVEMVATFRPTAGEGYEIAVETPAGRQGRTWDPTECPDFLVDAYVENGSPGFDATCRGA